MKKSLDKRLLPLLLAAALLCLALPAFAAQIPEVIFEDKDSGGIKVSIKPVNENYTDSDLFNEFKCLMPGDTRTQIITLKNEITNCERVKIYLRAVPHTNENPISDEVKKEIEGDKRRIAEESELEYMLAFLSKLKMTVADSDGEEIYSSTPDKTEGLTKPVFLGTYKKGDTEDLKVTLQVPIELGNEYSNRIGEVDWEFSVQCASSPEPPPTPPNTITVVKVWDDDHRNRPDRAYAALLNGTAVVNVVELNSANNWRHTWSGLSGGGYQVYETNIPKGYVPYYFVKNDVVTVTNASTLIQTGQINWLIPVFGGAGILLLTVGLIVTAKKRKKDNE